MAEKTKEIADLRQQLEKAIKKNESTNGGSCISKPSDQFQFLDADLIQEFETLEEIGSGGGGKVLKVAKKEIYALKVMNLSKNPDENQSSLRLFLGEYEILNMLNHPNILKTYGFYVNEKKPPSILLEFCPMNLDDLINNKKITKVELVCTIYQIVEGMKFVHFNKIVHRDLKPSNILLTKDGTVKIADFGIAKLMSAEQQLTTGGIGTQKFMAPEILNEENYNEKVDIYSFGVLVFSILNDGKLPTNKLRDICNGVKAEIPEKFTEFSKNLINSCWNFAPDDRPSFEEILNEIEANKYNLIDLNKFELQEVEVFVKNHKSQIPSY